MQFLTRFISTSFFIFLSLAQASATSVTVVTTIKPLHSLTAAVMQGVGEPHLLLSGNASPHGYALRPSDMRQINEADLIVWIGPDLETFLIKPLHALPEKEKRLLTIESTRGIRTLNYRSLSRNDDDDEYHDHHGHAGHDHGIDPHLWLDIDNAIVIVNAVRDALSEHDPDNASLYRSNAERTVQRLVSLNDTLKQKLALVKLIPFISFHDAYQYIEKSYGLSGIGSLAIDPDRPASVGHLREVRALIKRENVVCVFQEPQFPARIAETATEGTGTRLGILDPLGTDIADGADLYFIVMNNLGNALHRCLAP